MASNDPRRWSRVTAAPYLYTFGPACGSYSVTVPAGVLLREIEGEPGVYFVDEFAWLEGQGTVRHDAVHYGIRVPESATRERGKVPTAASFEASTRTIRSVPEGYWLASANSWDGAVAHDATCTALAAGLGFLHRVAEHSPGEFPAVELAALIDEARAVLTSAGAQLAPIATATVEG